MKLPIKITVDLIKTIEDATHYRCTVMVPNSEPSTTIATIRLEPPQKPVIESIEQNGLRPLAHDVRDRLLLMLFMLAYDEMLANDGSGIEWWISDIGRAVDHQFTAVDVVSIFFVLSSFVDPSFEVKNMNIVRID